MRLINTKDLEVEVFYKDIPRYAILSHTWEADEPSLQEWMDKMHRLKAMKADKQGYMKVASACLLAEAHGYDYIWVDTVCIDKSSSAELTEAINSMFRWYEDARMCFVYLSDVASPPLSAGRDVDEDILRAIGFHTSRWFTRGWTLQELLAPSMNKFYSRDWQFLGDKQRLCSIIANITAIDEGFIWYEQWAPDPRETVYRMSPFDASVAVRLSWLSYRQTTREEDLAYCMLGIFDINMPLLYGEGMKAFQRLQEEIMKVSDDHSLFCWSARSSIPPTGSLLAMHPQDFAVASRMRQKYGKKLSSYIMTNCGLSIKLPLLPAGNTDGFIGVLRANSADDLNSHAMGVYLCGIPESRLFRPAIPSTPIYLANEASISKTPSAVFISRPLPRRKPASFNAALGMPAVDMPLVCDGTGEACTAIVTLDSWDRSFILRTYPEQKFSSAKGFLALNFKFYNQADTLTLGRTSAVIVHAKVPKSTHISSFVVCCSAAEDGCGSSSSSDEKSNNHRWRWHTWRLRPEVAARLGSRRGHEKHVDRNCPELEDVKRAMLDPRYAIENDYRGDSLRFAVHIARRQTCAKLQTCAVLQVYRHIHLTWGKPPDVSTSSGFK